MISEYEKYKKEVIEPRKAKRSGQMLSSREMRRKLGRGNMKPKTIQQREIQNTLRRNKNLINSLKQQIILSEQKIQALQEEVTHVNERLDILEIKPEPNDDVMRIKFEDETGKKSLWRGKATKAYQDWQEKNK